MTIAQSKAARRQARQDKRYKYGGRAESKYKQRMRAMEKEKLIALRRAAAKHKK